MSGSIAAERYLPRGWTLPALTPWNRPFFTTERLMIQVCAVCDEAGVGAQHPPLDFCHRCQGDALEYREASGAGVVDNFSVVHHAGSALLKEALPYNVALVELDDHPGLLVLGNVVNPDWPDRLHIGAAVRVEFAEVPDPDEPGTTLRLPQWRLV
jgi:hypothetical protein